MKITLFGEYAVQLCILLSKCEGGKPLSASDMARELNIDVLYAQQVLHKLKVGEVVKSTRGAQGGYQLMKPARETTLKDIFLASEGDTFEMICNNKPIHEEKCSPTQSCALRSVWQEFKEHIDSFLISISLEELSRREAIENTSGRSELIQIRERAL